MAKPEQQLQNKVANYLRLRHPELLWTISPAGLVRGASMAVLMKRMGYMNGTPDLIIFEPRGIWHGLFVELKVPGGAVSPDQTSFLAKAFERRYATAVCWSYEEAIKTVDNYLEGGGLDGV
jgi:hypothetical protein